MCDSGVRRNLSEAQDTFVITRIGIGNKVEVRTVAEERKKTEERKDRNGMGKSSRFPNGDLGIFENESPPI